MVDLTRRRLLVLVLLGRLSTRRCMIRHKMQPVEKAGSPVPKGSTLLGGDTHPVPEGSSKC